MEYLLEMSRIVNGAVKGDKAKVLAYVEQLARKLRETGDPAAADRFDKALDRNRASEVSTAGAGTRRLPVDNESRLSLADESWMEPDDVTIVLDTPLQGKVDEFIRYIRAADQLLASRVGIVPSMLIYGPPGVGKTELAKHIAAQLQLPLITGRIDSLISSFLGNTAKNLRSLFEHAKSRPCVLFLDEIDAVAKLRDDQHELGELKRVVVSLLQNIDALDNQTVLLAATNHDHLLDPAVWRRFAYKLEITPPDFDSRREIFELFLGSYAPRLVDVEGFAELGEGITGADVRQISENAIRAAILSGESKVNSLDVIREIVTVRLGNKADFSSTDPSCFQAIHDLNPRVLSQRRLAAMFNVSESTVSRRLAEGKNEDG